MNRVLNHSWTLAIVITVAAITVDGWVARQPGQTERSTVIIKNGRIVDVIDGNFKELAGYGRCAVGNAEFKLIRAVEVGKGMECQQPVNDILPCESIFLSKGNAVEFENAVGGLGIDRHEVPSLV